MKKYNEHRVLYADKLRACCIANDWYTCGSNEEYAALFAKLRTTDGLYYAEITTDLLAEIANDILEHSYLPDDYEVTNIMFALARQCTTYFEEAAA